MLRYTLVAAARRGLPSAPGRVLPSLQPFGWMTSRLLATSNPAPELDDATILAKKIRFLNKNESIPKPPQRNTNSWQLFLKDKVTADMKAGTFTSVTISSREASALWRKLSDTEKQPFVDRATVLSAEHKKEYERWLAGLSPADVAVYNRVQRLRRKQGKGAAYLVDPSKPKRPLSAYFRFLAEQRAQHAGELPLTELSILSAQKWGSMSEADKKLYRDQEEKELVSYRKSNAAYRAQLPKPLDLTKAIKPAAKKPVKKPIKKVAKKTVKKPVKKPVKKTVKKVAKKPAKKPVKKTTRKA